MTEEMTDVAGQGVPLLVGTVAGGPARDHHLGTTTDGEMTEAETTGADVGIAATVVTIDVMTGNQQRETPIEVATDVSQLWTSESSNVIKVKVLPPEVTPGPTSGKRGTKTLRSVIKEALNKQPTESYVISYGVNLL